MEKQTEFAGEELSRRERQIMEIVYSLGKATVQQVADRLPDSPTASSARAMMHILKKKGYLVSRHDGPRKVYRPTVRLEAARKSALEHVMDTFYRGAEASAVISILKKSEASLSEEDKERILELIEGARREGR